MGKLPKWVIIMGVVVLFLCCCLILIFAGVATLNLHGTQTPTLEKMVNTPTAFVFSNPTPEVTLPSNTETEPRPTPTDEIMDGSQETLRTLAEAQVPINDLRDLAQRLKGIRNIPETMPNPDIPYEISARRNFWVINHDTNRFKQIDATLQYANEIMYFWVEDGVAFRKDEAKILLDEFRDEIYPTNRQFFGSEWSPGIDQDPKIYLIYTRYLGARIAGSFGPLDELPRAAHEYSNMFEGFMVASSQKLGDTYTFGTLAHEFQHMIHWFQDRNEDSWLNEGFSELAVDLNGYGSGDKAFLYALEPDTMLTDWPNDPDQTSIHYGVAYMFVKYFLGRFGDTATQALVAEKSNGLASVDEVLNSLGVKDAVTGVPLSADDVFADWTAANYLQDNRVGDGRYSYIGYEDAPSFTDTESFYNCPVDWQSRTVNQYGVDYIRIACRGSFSLNFQGAQKVGVLPTSAHSGKYAFWSNKGDESDMTLTQTFDFTTVSGPLKFSYSTWYDLEEDYDYAYLVASPDGQNWEILSTPSCTTKNPSGNSYGCGYNGQTEGWIQETVDLSKFSEKKVILRFEYITDAAVNGEGFLIDDIAIPAIGYSADFEEDDGGWEAAGFVRIQNELPQTFQVSLIREGSQTIVERIELSADQTLILPLELNEDVVLIVSGTTRFTRQPAEYRFGLSD